MPIKKVYYDSEIHIHTQAEAEAMLDKLSGDDRFWQAIKGNLLNGGSGSDLGSDIHNLIERIEEELASPEPEGLDNKRYDDEHATNPGAA